MGRIFRRGELKEAVIAVLAALGEAHGYAIMTELRERIGGGWKPSPGAVYPALLALEETGYVRVAERDGNKVYRLTEAGLRAAKNISPASRWSSLASRSQSDEERVTVGTLLDRFASESLLRRRVAGPEKRQQIEEVLSRASGEIEQALEKGDSDG